jgi:hypothetical protein
MSLKVIGSGFGQTGTKSMKEALEVLGLGPCRHMIEVMETPDLRGAHPLDHPCMRRPR